MNIRALTLIFLVILAFFIPDITSKVAKKTPTAKKVVQAAKSKVKKVIE